MQVAPVLESDATSARDAHAALLLEAGRVLLEYNESSGEIVRTLKSTANALGEDVIDVALTYRGIAISLPGVAPALKTIHELRFNAAVQERTHGLLIRLRRGELDAPAALAELGRVESETRRNNRWAVAALLGAAAASFACILGADAGAMAVTAIATSLGLLLRQALGRRHFALLTLPLSASLLGAVLAGIAIRLGWTRSPALAVIVPALMVVPGPHFLNSMFDLIDNEVTMSISRLWLAAGVLVAAGLGVVIGMELAVPSDFFTRGSAEGFKLNLVSDMVLAGIAACGFAAFYNVKWNRLWMVAVGGMAGHGLRFFLLHAGLRLELATCLGGVMVGIVAAWMARSGKAPIAVLAFAGAVTMIPGLALYRALGGILQIAGAADGGDPALVAKTLGSGFQGSLAVCGLALGLIVGSRAMTALARR